MSVFAGKHAIVTGGNTGLGLQTTIELTKQGFHVTITGICPRYDNAFLHWVKFPFMLIISPFRGERQGCCRRCVTRK